jgi:ribonuclease HI
LADFVVETLTSIPNIQDTEQERRVVYVDGASSIKGADIGVTMVSPKGDFLNYALQLLFTTSNNTAKYEAMLAGLRLAKGVSARRVLLYIDSQLAVNQIFRLYEVRYQKLEKYLEELQRLSDEFEHIEILHVSRGRNRKADALSKLAAEGNLDKDKPITVLEMQSPSVDVEFLEQLLVEEAGEWYMPIWDFLTRGSLPNDPVEAARIRRWSAHFMIKKDCLYKRGISRPWLKCIGKTQSQGILQEIHEGMCGSHQGAKTIAHRALRAGFYWPTMKEDAKTLVKRCVKCQLHAKMPHQPAQPMKSIFSPWPFDVCGELIWSAYF